MAFAQGRFHSCRETGPGPALASRAPNPVACEIRVRARDFACRAGAALLLGTALTLAPRGASATEPAAPSLETAKPAASAPATAERATAASHPSSSPPATLNDLAAWLDYRDGQHIAALPQEA